MNHADLCVVFPWHYTFTAFLKGEREELGMKNLRVLRSADLGIIFKAELGVLFGGVRSCKGADCRKRCLFKCVRGLFACVARSFKCQFGAEYGVSGYS